MVFKNTYHKSFRSLPIFIELFLSHKVLINYCLSLIAILCASFLKFAVHDC